MARYHPPPRKCDVCVQRGPTSRCDGDWPCNYCRKYVIECLFDGTYGPPNIPDLPPDEEEEEEEEVDAPPPPPRHDRNLRPRGQRQYSSEDERPSRQRRDANRGDGDRRGREIVDARRDREDLRDYPRRDRDRSHDRDHSRRTD
ncbi:hypothetical protein FRC08_007546, partial [Ceratobasidium sp. 394]